MINLRPAKAVQGEVTLPVSPDLLYMAALGACAAGRDIVIGNVGETEVVNEIVRSLNSHANIALDGSASTLRVGPLSDDQNSDPALLLTLPSALLPYRAIYLFIGLGMGKTVVIKSASEKELQNFISQAKRVGITAETVNVDEENKIVGLRSTYFDSGIAESSSPIEEDCSALIAFLLGKNGKLTFATAGYHISTPLRPLAAALGLTFNAKLSASGDANDPVAKRMRFMQGKQREHTNQSLLYTIDVDFTVGALCATPAAVIDGDTVKSYGDRDVNSSDDNNVDPSSGNKNAANDPIDIAIPGDETLAAALIVLKRLVPKGEFEIANVPLESWASQTISLLKKMGCKIVTKESAKTAFGAAGTVVVQKSDITGRKSRCAPLYQYVGQLPCMIVASAFAEGKSVFRDLDALRLSEPDGLDLLERSLRPLGARHGEMPDGIVVEGARDFDGFDIIEPLPAHLAVAFCVAGLKCMGKTSIADDNIMARWPKFEEMIVEICEFRAK